MEKRYQVFVSSTYVDLREERQHVIQTLMEMDCIPSGMELFPAADEEQWQFIKRVINDCDYYLLIIGGRYGSTTEEGISYTEKEYDYAIEKGLKVIALIHGKPNELSIEKSDIKPELREKLDKFRQRVKTNRLVKFWEKASDLPGLVALSLSKTIKTHPAVGWVRADQVSNTELLSELNELRKNKELLEVEIGNLKSSFDASIFTPKEETEFNYIYSQLKGLHTGFCQVWIEEDKKAPRVQKQGIFQYSLLKALVENVQIGITEFDADFLYVVRLRIEELTSFAEYIKLGYEFLSFQPATKLRGDLIMFGFLNITPVSQDFGSGIRSYNVFLFSEKLYRFINWLIYYKRIEGEQTPDSIKIS